MLFRLQGILLRRRNQYLYKSFIFSTALVTLGLFAFSRNGRNDSFYCLLEEILGLVRENSITIVMFLVALNPTLTPASRPMFQNLFVSNLENP